MPKILIHFNLNIYPIILQIISSQTQFKHLNL